MILEVAAGAVFGALYASAGYGLGHLLDERADREIDPSSFYGGWLASMTVICAIVAIVIWAVLP